MVAKNLVHFCKQVFSLTGSPQHLTQIPMATHRGPPQTEPIWWSRRGCGF